MRIPSYPATQTSEPTPSHFQRWRLLLTLAYGLIAVLCVYPWGDTRGWWSGPLLMFGQGWTGMASVGVVLTLLLGAAILSPGVRFSPGAIVLAILGVVLWLAVGRWAVAMEAL